MAGALATPFRRRYVARVSAAPRILLVRFSSLGDVVLTTPLVRALRRAFPSAEITFVTKRRYAALLGGNPAIDRIEALEAGESLRSLAGRLRGRPFDHGLDLQGSLRSLALRRAVRGRWTGYGKRRGRRWRLLLAGGHAQPDDVPVAERYFGAAAHLGIRPDGEPAEVFPSAPAREAAAALGPAGFVALAPGARHHTKRWPPGHWRALAERLAERGLAVVGVGDAAERELLCGGPIGEAYGAPLDVTAALLARALVVVANDSGLMHLATAVRRPVVALFGPTVRALGFSPYRAEAVVLERAMRCRPCSATGGPFCPLLHHRCLRDITPAEVAARVLAAAA
jgi:ADP-heptose:LPS heptosyltransferase